MITKEQVIEKLKEVTDPEIGANVVDLGLIYDIDIEDGKVKIMMTLTTPACPLMFSLPEMVREKVSELNVDVDVEITFDPPWDPSRMSPELRKRLGIE